MPSTIDLLFYVALGAGALFTLCAAGVYVFTQQASRGTIGIALIGTFLICAGILATLKVSWDEKGGSVELETTKVLSEGLAGAANAVAELQKAQTGSVERLQSQIDTVIQRQEAQIASKSRGKYETLGGVKGVAEWGWATAANIDVLNTQLKGVLLSMSQLQSTRVHCAIATAKGGAQQPK